MHSRIFELKKAKEKIEWIDGIRASEEDMIDGIANYYTDTSDRKEDVQWLVETLADHFISYDSENESITFLEGFKEEYFREKYNKFKEIAKTACLDKYMDPFFAHDLSVCIDNKYEFYIYDDDYYAKTLDQFIRELPDIKATFHIGGIVDYHF